MNCSIVNINTTNHINHDKTTAFNSYTHSSYTHEYLYSSFIECEFDKEPIPVSLVKQGKSIKEHNNIMALNKKKRF